MNKVFFIPVLMFFLTYSSEAISQSKYETYKEFYGKSTTKKCYFPNDSMLVVFIDLGNEIEFEEYFTYDKDGDNVSIIYRCPKNFDILKNLFSNAYSQGVTLKWDDDSFIDKNGNWLRLMKDENDLPSSVLFLTKRKRVNEIMGFNSPLFPELTAEQVYAKVNDAVVTIYTFDANGKLIKQGSGVVLNDKGWVVTNYHVYAGAEKLVVKHKDKVVKHTAIIGLDVEKDILIIKISDKTFPSISLGNSDSIKVGQRIYAIGSPMGFENTITEGIISGVRSYEERTKNFIQVSAAISPGSSGGAVVDSKGKLIAITTLTITNGQNLNFAIPINEVLKIYKQAGIEPKDFSASFYLHKGNVESDQNNYDAAIDNYKKAIKINPKYTGAYYNLGNAYSKKGDIENAIAYYKKAIEFDPKYVYAYYNLGIKYKEKGEVETAIGYFKKAIAINTEFVEAYNNLGATYCDKEEIEIAIMYFKKAIEINPRFAQTYFNLGVVYRDKKDFETAITYFKKSIEINPKYTDAYYSLGGIYTSKEEFETAIAYYQEVLSINPEYPDAYYGLGFIYTKKRELETAISYFKKVITLNSAYASAYLALGNLYGAKGDINLKNYYLEKAYQLDPSLKNK